MGQGLCLTFIWDKIVISFGGDDVKVVYAASKSSGSVVKKTLTFTNAEFEGFLQRDKNKEFVVVYDFKTFYSDLLHVPPLKGKYLKSIIESEIRKEISKLNPEQREEPRFSDHCFYI